MTSSMIGSSLVVAEGSRPALTELLRYQLSEDCDGEWGMQVVRVSLVCRVRVVISYWWCKETHRKSTSIAWEQLLMVTYYCILANIVTGQYSFPATCYKVRDAFLQTRPVWWVSWYSISWLQRWFVGSWSGVDPDLWQPAEASTGSEERLLLWHLLSGKITNHALLPSFSKAKLAN